MGNHLESYKVLIGKKIQRRRVEQGFSSQGELAKKLGTDASQVSRWESGKHMPEGQLRAGLCELLKVDDTFFEMIEVDSTPVSAPATSRSDLILGLFSSLSTLTEEQLIDLSDALEIIKSQPNIDKIDLEEIAKKHK